METGVITLGLAAATAMGGFVIGIAQAQVGKNERLYLRSIGTILAVTCIVILVGHPYPH